VAAAITAAVLPLRRRHQPGELLCGAALACALLGALVAWLAPGASYLFVVPALCSAAGAAIALAHEDRRWSWWAPAAAVAAVLLYAPLAVSLNRALTLGLVPVIGAVLGLIGGVVLPHVVVLRRRWIVPAGLAGVGLALGLGSVWSATIDKDCRRTDNLAYLWDEDTGIASFASADAEVDEWTRLALGEGPRRMPLEGWFPGSKSTFLVVSTQKREVAVPRIATSVGADGARTFELSFDDPVERLELTLTGAVQSVEVDGVSLEATRQIRYWAPPTRLTVRATGGGPDTRLTLRAIYYRLPGAVPPRPEHLMQTPFGFGWPDLTIVGVSAPPSR
jgi:hypothetical protein